MLLVGPIDRRDRMASPGLFLWFEEVDRREGEALAVCVVELGEVVDPEFDEAVEVDQGEAAFLLVSCFALRVGGKAAGGDVDADVVFAEDGEEGAQPFDG